MTKTRLQTTCPGLETPVTVPLVDPEEDNPQKREDTIEIAAPKPVVVS